VPDKDRIVFDFTPAVVGVSGQVATEGEHEAIMDAASTFVPNSGKATDHVKIVKTD
jgi:hypothetical protein